MRIDRKREHIEYFLKTKQTGDTLFSDIVLNYNSLPELNLDEIDISVEFLSRRLELPFMINAMTGGSEFTKKYNEAFAKIAKEYGIAMAVGSQTAMFESDSLRDSYRIVREHTDGIVLANLSGSASLEMARAAIDLIDADGIQLHINPAQELAMSEGDRNFRGIEKNIEYLLNNLDLPVIVKDVGIGMGPDVVRRLVKAGVKYIDISAKGGTNFIEIESMRWDMKFSDLMEIGIPTALATIKAREVSDDFYLISSGGISSAMEIVKAIVIGGDLVSMAGIFLRVFETGGMEALRVFVKDLTYKIKMIMLILGVKNIDELKKLDYKIVGRLAEYI